jgi:hypothetical protein
MIRYKATLTMIVKLMLPISIVEQPGFKEFILKLDPQVTVPNRYSIKTQGLIYLNNIVINKINEIISKCEHINISNDGWTDATARCFDGYIIQSIDNDWNLVTLPIAFRQSFSHDFKSIQDQYNLVCKEFKIENKIYKILSDQAAANKKAFKDIIESQNVINETVNLILLQWAKDRKEKRRKIEEAKQAELVKQHEKEIGVMNASEKEDRKYFFKIE